MNIKKVLYNQPDQSYSFWSVFSFLNLENLIQNSYFFSFHQPESNRKEGRRQYHVLRSLLLYVLIIQSCLTLCDPMDCSPPGSSVHGIFQATILEWVALPSSRGSSRPSNQASLSYVSCIVRWAFYHQGHLGSPSFSSGPHATGNWHVWRAELVSLTVISFLQILLPLLLVLGRLPWRELKYVVIGAS